MTDAIMPGWAPTAADEWGTTIRARLGADVTGSLDALGAHLSTLGDAFTQRRELKKTWLRRTAKLLTPDTHGFVLGAVAALADGESRRTLIGRENRDLAMGFVVAAGHTGLPEAVAALLRLARRAAAVHGTGMLTRDDGFAQVACYALADLEALEALDALGELRRDISYVILNERVTEVLKETADALGVAEDDWMERAIPAWGIGNDGVGTIGPMGEGTVSGNAPYRAEIVVGGHDSVRLNWLGDDGSTTSTRHPFPSPAGYKSRFGAHNTEGTQRAAKRVVGELAAERRRIARLPRTRTWPHWDWRRLYLDHPITGAVARAVIWEFTDGDGRTVAAIPVAGGGYASVGAPPTAPVEVRLWDAARAGGDEAARWRKYLDDTGVRLAFGQLP